MSTIEERLTPLDATFLELEQAAEGAMMHIGGALVFDAPADGGPAPSVEQLIALLEERFEALPRFRCRLSEDHVHGLRRPAWIEDPTFDLHAHVRHATLPTPGGEDEMHEWLADFWSHRLDRARPLWEMTLVDGLRDGRWMLATKTHHAMVDGVGSIDVGHVLLDTELTDAPRGTGASAPNGAPPAPETDGLPGWLPPVIDAAHAAAGAGRVVVGAAQAAVGTAQAAVDAALHPRRLLRAGQAAAAMSEVLWKDEILAARPSTLNVPIGTSRRFTSVGFELTGIKAIKAGLGGTINDVVLALTTGALRRLLSERGEELERPLRAMVPVNLRSPENGSLGNQVTSLFVELPIGEADRHARYDATRAAATELKSGSAALGGSTIVLVAGVAPPLLHESIARMLFAPRLFNLTITNVPGPQITLYALGSRMRSIVPLVPLFADHTIGLAIVSYDGNLVFGINADHAAAPDLDVFADALREEHAALSALAAPSA